jgi:hypothetical protein
MKKHSLIFGFASILVLGLLAVNPFGHGIVQDQRGTTGAAAVNDGGKAIAAVRPAYPFSLIWRGVASVEEFCQKTQEDALLRYYTRSFSCGDAYSMTYSHDVNVYVSFLQGGKIWWTRKPMLVRAGTGVITDGSRKFLMRCGNEFSWIPMVPSKDIPPPVLDTPVAGPIVPTYPFKPSYPAVTTYSPTPEPPLVPVVYGGSYPFHPAIAADEPPVWLMLLSGLVILVLIRR